MKIKQVRLFLTIILLMMVVFMLGRCNYNDENNDAGSSPVNNQHITDEELIDIALNISKTENNYTYWLFSHNNDVNVSEIVQVETKYILNGEEFSTFENYAPVSEFESIEDFVNKASRYLSSDYIENYLYKYIGLHPTDNIPAPLLLDLDGRLYKNTTINGVSIIPNIAYTHGEVIEKAKYSAVVRLYVDSDISTDISYVDFPLILEDDIWKYNPSY